MKKKLIFLKGKNFFKKKKIKKTLRVFRSNNIFINTKSYLEDFKSINHSLDLSYWPKLVKFSLLTIIKLMMFLKSGVQIWLIIKLNILFYNTVEILAHQNLKLRKIFRKSRSYFSWGWKDKIYKNVKPFCAFNFNFIKKDNFFKNKNLLICVHFNSKYSYRISSLPKTNFDRINRLFRIKKLIKNLNSKNPITLRYQKSLEKNFEVKFNKNFFPGYINYDTGKPFGK